MILIRAFLKNLATLTLALITEYRETNERNQPFITVTTYDLDFSQFRSLRYRFSVWKTAAGSCHRKSILVNFISFRRFMRPVRNKWNVALGRTGEWGHDHAEKSFARTARKRGHEYHAPRVKPTINCQVKLLRFAFRCPIIHGFVENATCPFAATTALDPTETAMFTVQPLFIQPSRGREVKKRRGWSDEETRINFDRGEGWISSNKTTRRARNYAASALTTNASKSDKRVSIPRPRPIVSATRKYEPWLTHRTLWKRGKRERPAS